ncbi:MAG: TIGR00730 family Rossman fold protein [Planctomycetaceae bacterium]|nr:TIGR00730 family Rossman fold protein [Planctomycetaceae bacterium]
MSRKQKRKHASPQLSEEIVIQDVVESYIEPISPQAVETQRLIDEIKQTADKLKEDGARQGDLKIISSAIKELRYAFKVFTPYRRNRKVSVFGSARCQPDDLNYQMAVEYGKRMASEGWYVVTGAGGGIMEAANVGAGASQSMGLNIMLPFEQQANHILRDDPKLVNMKYFFTRKLLFVKEVHAIVIFPGGYGTLDECMETLTLVQTGKRDLMPIVLIGDPKEQYWKDWDRLVHKELLDAGLISDEDTSLYHITDNVDDAVEEVMKFYSVYNSMRYVRGKLVLRLHMEPSDEFVERLNEEFGSLCESGQIEKTTVHHLEADDTHLADLPRLTFQFNRKDIGRLRQMIDLINNELAIIEEV